MLIVLVRHAQANFQADPEQAFESYDRLSELGWHQAESLGRELVRSRTRFDHVIVGPALRHRQTADAVRSAYEEAGHALPEYTEIAEFAEHEGSQVVSRALELDEYQAMLEAHGGDTDDQHARGRAYLKLFRDVMRLWSRGDLPHEVTAENEDWQTFRARVHTGLGHALERAENGATVGVFTSGGPVGSTVGRILGLDDERSMELAWVVQNATVSELYRLDGTVSLKSFNVQPRMGIPELVTYV